MKVVLASPFYEQQRGNTVTVDRIASGLKERKIETDVISITENDQTDLLSFADLVHGFNAFRFYEFMQKLDFKIHPYVITLTGTDLNYDLFDQERRDQVIETLIDAKAVHVFEEKGKRMVAEEIPEIKNKLFVIQQGVGEFPDVASPFVKESSTFLFTLPAGIRKIKNITSAIKMLASIQKKYTHIRLWIAGPILETEEGKNVQQLVDENQHWVRYVGEIPHEQMGALYAESDVVLNTSYSEGQPSSLLEAMSLGVPTLVSNNNGNKSIVTHGETGFVYCDEQDFMKYARQLIEHPVAKLKMGRLGQAYVKEHHSIKHEVAMLLAIYTNVLKEVEEKSCQIKIKSN